MKTATKMAVAISPAGSVELIDLSSGSLEKLQTAVGGWVQAIELSNELTLWCNEEGKMNGLEFNPFAQHLWCQAFGAGTDYIVGTVVLTGGTDDEGDTIGITEEQILSLFK
jgi:hypothetical protein